ncbi:MAG: hypothetical protein ABI408_08140 [Gemmatimonadaceae bacterium]
MAVVLENASAVKTISHRSSRTLSSFPYLSYYEALATVRGAIAGKGKAIAFDIDELGKKRVIESLP